MSLWFTIKDLVTPLIVPLCLTVFANTFTNGAFPALLPEIARSGGLPDWQLGAVASAFGFARMLADVPVGLFLTHHLRPALVLGPCLLAAGVVIVVAGGSFPLVVLGRLLMGVGHGLSMMGGITALLQFGTGVKPASALNAFEFSAMLGLLGGTALVGLLPTSLGWSAAFLAAGAPILLGLVTIPALLRALPAAPSAGHRPLFARHAVTAARPSPPTPAVVLTFAAGGAAAAAYSTVEQFMLPLRGSRALGLERAGISRLLLTMQVCDIAALLPVGVLADRVGVPRVLGVILLVMASASLLIAYGGLPVVVAGAALFGFSMAGWMLPLGVLKRETAPERIAWRTGLYRVCVDGGIFAGPFLGGLLGAELAPNLGAVWAGALALAGVLFLVHRR
jgi:predicted MFS family arabinose efflux permease